MNFEGTYIGASIRPYSRYGRPIVFCGMLAIILVAGGILALYCSRKNVVVFALGTPNINDHHGFEILNPFRDRRLEER
ncbi:MAG: hypothetical protein JWQ87_5284 [Candidatus Sulfotelmatobacter sp.]|nr:hypothetical protein [Candidatus Sulfotelmatobacter sp.]